MCESKHLLIILVHHNSYSLSVKMVEAIVDFDYLAQEPDELSIRKGDVLRNITIKPGGWWEGTLNDKRGVFPDNFVHIIEKNPSVALREKSKRQCQAIFSYSPQHEDELSLNVGDIIDILGEVEEGWWRGRLGAKEGVFPSNFVQEIHPYVSNSVSRKKKFSSKEDLTCLAGEADSGSPSLPPKPVKILCQAQYPYEAQNEDELTLDTGDIITLISKDGQDKGWWRGELHGRVGVFPDNFVIALPIQDQNQKTAVDKKPQQQIKPNQSTAAVRKEIAPKLISNVALQRKSLELGPKVEGPPIPGKKPAVPIKKSPSLSGSGGGIFSGLKQKVMGIEQKISDKVADSTDGISSSRIQPSKEDTESKQDEFDKVERSSMLSDLRANRAKAPRRRPPSMVLRDFEPGLINGNAEHAVPSSPLSSPLINDEQESETECKPKPRDWEKHKAPWMDELKLNQAKKTSPLNPSPETSTRFKFTSPSEKFKSSNERLDSSTEIDCIETPKRSRFEKESSSNDMTKSASSASGRLTRTPTPDLPESGKPGIVIRNRTSLQPLSTTTTSSPPLRPQTIHSESDKVLSNAEANKVSPGIIRNQSPSPISKPPIGEKFTSDKKFESSGVVTLKQYQDLEERVKQLENTIEKQNQSYMMMFQDLQKKLQAEVDLRERLQLEMDKLSQCVTQV